jgi:CRISPR-associated protein Cmr6
MEQGKIKISNKGWCQIQISGKRIDIPKRFAIDAQHNGLECEFLREKGEIIKIIINGQEILAAPPPVRLPEFVKDEIISNSKLPKDSRRILNKMADEIDNFSLRLNKCSYFLEENRKEKTIVYRKADKVIPRTIRHTLERPPHANYGITNFNQICNYNRNRATALLGENVVHRNYTTIDRLIIGLGAASVFETSITLHHVYGFPYIPSTSIKGIVRSAIIRACFESSEAKAIQDKLFCDLFGCPAKIKENNQEFPSWYETHESTPNNSVGDRQGKIIFFDAFPCIAPTIKEDIINVHFSDYYTGENKPPTDSGSPNPITFLTVVNTQFGFILGTKYNYLVDNTQAQSPIAQSAYQNTDTTLLDIIQFWLDKSLTHYGVGAKTALGYGFFRLVN